MFKRPRKGAHGAGEREWSVSGQCSMFVRALSKTFSFNRQKSSGVVQSALVAVWRF